MEFNSWLSNLRNGPSKLSGLGIQAESCTRSFSRWECTELKCMPLGSQARGITSKKPPRPATCLKVKIQRVSVPFWESSGRFYKLSKCLLICLFSRCKSSFKNKQTSLLFGSYSSVDFSSPSLCSLPSSLPLSLSLLPPPSPLPCCSLFNFLSYVPFLASILIFHCCRLLLIYT